MRYTSIPSAAVALVLSMTSGVARATRRDFLVRFCGTPTVILPTHFRRGTAGRIVAGAGR